jgi:predicted Rossmann fold nucleotide-binding protein DprA/Smf involved in DNA uptake
LLCGRFGGEKQEPFQPLSSREYGELARWLNARSLRPSDLLTAQGHEALADLHEARLERKRVDFLLGRGTAMALALERWSRGGLWVMSRGDSDFPKRLKRHLKNSAPPLLYGAGDRSLLDSGGLAIIGSRDASASALEYTRWVAARCSKEGMAVVSGGARGVDAASMQGATEAGGRCIGVLACDLLKTSVNRQNRIGLQEGRLVLISPFFPEAGFNAGNAMGRNRYIYTLADHALVIDSALRSGGTWEGAVENLKKEWVPLYVRIPGEGLGNGALVADGALPFTLTMDSTDSLSELFSTQVAATTTADTDSTGSQTSLLASEPKSSAPSASVKPTTSSEQEPPSMPAVVTPSLKQTPAEVELVNLSFDADASGPRLASEPAEDHGAEAIKQIVTLGAGSGSLDMYSDFMEKLRVLLAEAPIPEDDIACQLGLEKAQAKVWLKRASEVGIVEKLKKPVRYSLMSKQLF